MDARARSVIASVVTVRNPQGHALHCVLEEPAPRVVPAQIAAVLFCPGVKTRVGPHRLNRKLARPFLERGIPVLRVDFRGLGDSEGEWPDDSLEHIYRQTELGHCVGDARAALDWLESRFGIRRFVVGGLCGAAMTALHLAREDARLQALFAVGLPARLAPEAGAPVATRAELQSHWSRLLRKATRPAAWLRFFSLQSDYRLIGRTLAARLRRLAPRRPACEPAPARDLNPHLPSSMLELLRTGRSALILFGEHDPRRWDFEERFLEPWADVLRPHRTQITYSIVPGANHVLGTPGAVAEAARRTSAWLAEMLRSDGGVTASSVHEAALECVVKPIGASGRHDVKPCSTNEYSISTQLPK